MEEENTEWKDIEDSEVKDVKEEDESKNNQESSLPNESYNKTKDSTHGTTEEDSKLLEVETISDDPNREQSTDNNEEDLDNQVTELENGGTELQDGGCGPQTDHSSDIGAGKAELHQPTQENNDKEKSLTDNENQKDRNEDSGKCEENAHVRDENLKISKEDAKAGELSTEGGDEMLVENGCENPRVSGENDTASNENIEASNETTAVSNEDTKVEYGITNNIVDAGNENMESNTEELGVIDNVDGSNETKDMQKTHTKTGQGEETKSDRSKKSPNSKNSSPKTRKLPPLQGPLRFPTLGVNDQVYHPAPTPRRQLRPMAFRHNNLSSYSSGIDSNYDFHPDINSLSGQQSRYEDSIADSGFVSSSYPQTNPPHILNSEEVDDVEIPYQPQKFKSSTVMRMVTVPRRHQDMFGNKERFYSKNRPTAFHTGRYNYLESMTNRIETSSQLTQRQRLLLETAHLEKLRDVRKELNTHAPHRLPLNLAMGGSKAEFFDRVDIPQELRELKNIILPTHARDLYVGRGINLPEGHALNKPRRLGPLT